MEWRQVIMWFVGCFRAWRWKWSEWSMPGRKGIGDVCNSRESDDGWGLGDDHFKDVCAHVVKEEWVVKGVPRERERGRMVEIDECCCENGDAAVESVPSVLG